MDFMYNQYSSSPFTKPDSRTVYIHAMTVDSLCGLEESPAWKVHLILWQTIRNLVQMLQNFLLSRDSLGGAKYFL